MLKYDSIINRMSENEKIEILTNLCGMNEKTFEKLGFAPLKVETLTNAMENVYPTPTVTARSWNDELVGCIGAERASVMAKRGTVLAFTPAARIKIDPYASALSDDVCVSENIAKAFACGVCEGGVTAVSSGCGVTSDDRKWLGTHPDENVIYEYIAKPYFDMINSHHGISVGVSSDPGDENFSYVNSALTESIIRVTDDNSYAVCEYADGVDTVKLVARGAVCLSGSEYSLRAALQKYANMKRSMDKGELDEDELLESMKSGMAISPDMIDIAVDRVLSFLSHMENVRTRAATDATVNGYRTDEIVRRAAEESVVLLKNEKKALPVKGAKSVAVIGEPAVPETERTAYIDRFISRIEFNGIKVVGYARGYESDSDIIDERAEQEACSLIGRADCIILFLGIGEKKGRRIKNTRCLSLGANQDHLAQRLRSAVCSKNVKTAVMLAGDPAVDVTSADLFEAVMLYSPGGQYSPEVNADALCGVFSPSGHLAEELYKNADRSFLRRRRMMEQELGAGRFIGYRYYDSAGFKTAFPFGHGLSYSTFTYSAIKITNNSDVSVTVKNTGKISAAEVVQLYAGLDDEKYLRPKRELIAYKKLFLKPGEASTVTFENVRLPEIYDGSAGKFSIQGGRYTLYVSTSVENVKGKIKITADGDLHEYPCEQLSDYLFNRTNILTGNYTLEAKYSTMKKALRNIICGAVFILLAVALQVYCIVTNTNSAFLNIITVVVLGLAIAFFILDAIDRRRMSELDQQKADKANREWFEDATKLKSFSAADIFSDVQPVEPEVDTESDELPVTLSQPVNEYLELADKNFTFGNCADEFEIFAAERGCKIDKSNVYTLLSAIASTKVVIINGLSNDEFMKLAHVLCEYVNCNFRADVADATYTDDRSIFVHADGENLSDTGALKTLREACESPSALHIAVIANVGENIMNNCFSEIVRYAKNPTLSPRIMSIKEEYRFPENLLFLLGTDSDLMLSDFPGEVADVSAVCNLKVILTDELKEFGLAHKLDFYQLKYLTDCATSADLIPEKEWKKIDALEKCVSERTEYSIGNKRWLGLERFASAFAAAGGEPKDAVDRAAASELFPEIIALLAKNGLQVDAGFKEETDRIFGAGYATHLFRILKTAQFDPTKKIQGEATNASIS